MKIAQVKCMDSSKYDLGIKEGFRTLFLLKFIIFSPISSWYDNDFDKNKILEKLSGKICYLIV